MSLVMINFWYVVAAALFIFGLKKLGSPDSAVKGNMYSAAAMLIAVAVTLFNENILSFDWIIFAAVAGSIIGALAAQRVQMTSMPGNGCNF
jgi:NAD(P) transhydrogenase subunit beta